ncbi:murein biosynthesis integral membrane protein MurJ [Krasilnikovia sp. MM14-A1004]|uniref:murein biosynthesis integral membrane protein MurJ n=1 Tax=Krasilnikovia sp. MM14-A1004 TaxID=3373541 RepID=UPI00399D458A
MAVATVASRAAGFVRILVLTAALGLGSRLLDSYNVANTLPNAVFEVVAGGVLASVVVPMLARAAATDDDAGVGYAQRLLSLTVYALTALTLLALVAAPWLVRIYGPGFTAAQRELAVAFSRFFLPQILFYGVSATAGAVLTVRGRFAAPMWAPLANSLVVIAVGLGYLAAGGTTRVGELTTGELTLLGLGTSAGVLAQTAVVVWSLSRSGFPVRLRADPRGVALRRIARVGGWALLSVGAAQVLLAVATRVASRGGPGGLSAYQHAFTVFQVPFAVVAVSVMTALMPRLSRSAARRDHEQVIGDLSLAARIAVVAVAPVAVALMLLGPQIAVLLFAHGRSAAPTVALLGAVLAAFGVALVPFTGYMVLQRGFYALQDTRTPALITAGTSAAGVAGCLVAAGLLPPERVVIGVPVAYAVAYTLGLAATALALRARLGRLDGHRLVRTHLRVLVAAGAGAGCALVASRELAPVVAPGWLGALVTVVVAGAAGAVGYAGAARMVRLSELRRLVLLR